MAHIDDPIEPLETTATQADIIRKINEMIEMINLMWHPSDE